MGKGHDYLHRIGEALGAFEEAIKRREHPGILGSKVSLQQEVDAARQHVVDTVVEIVTGERMKGEAAKG